MHRFGIFLTICFIHFSVWCSAQEEPTDSLLKVLSTEKEDTFKINTLLLLSKNSGPEAGLQAKQLAEKLGFKKGVAAALKNIGLVFYNQGNYKQALVYWNASLQQFKAAGDEEGVSNLLSNLGAVYFN